MSALKKLAGQTALYGISTILGRVLNYFLTPLYTAVFLQDDYGLMSLLYAFAAFFNVIYTYGMETAYFRFAAKGNAARIYHLILTSVILTSILFSAILIFLSPQLMQMLGYPGKEIYIVWLSLIFAIDAILAIPYARLRQEQKAMLFASTKLINIFLTIFLNIFFLVICRDVYNGKYLLFLQPLVTSFYLPDFGVGYVFLANLIANLFVILLLYRSFLSFRFVFSWKELAPLLRYGYPLIFVGLAGMVNSMFDKIMLQYFLPEGFYPGLSNTGAMGVYAACIRLAIFMSLIVQAFRFAAEPFFFQQAEEKNAPDLFARVMRYFVIACVMIWLLVSLNLDIFKWIFLRKEVYHQGLGVVPVVLLGNLFLGVYFNLSVWYKLTDKTYVGTWITLAGAIFTVCSNLLLIPLLGYMGAATTVLLTYFLMSVICYVTGQKHFPVPYDLVSFSLHIFVGFALIVLSFYLRGEQWIRNFGINQVLFLLYLVFFWITEGKKLIGNLKRVQKT